ncbi:L-isoaspartyl protein carboxyl methyltransferase [Candidatus Parcubacteria bacterium]|uniref:Protein-L-isoaspartate O-methyltransferase n=1 Tax=Candidatus Kaiserbacteria bacterium CG10_big_fil_rev_8_21_14_0_10_47_16 TaxID=1974608 RepID=A0A2H0UD52_9BACT|nr:L-isoaspartyl protein carboxyl methyltransferase [Candidatus Parcubacteria bacterium]PIR84339.1 MAG: L-isoaspartyl protein carboxyl methyltransferase [Candidatus Kaiserbacteria bacterium CG10_big_fil_rev_8_21_14_0_10_47_16]
MTGFLSGLITKLYRDEEVLKTPVVVDAFRRIDRIDFVPEKFKKDAYGDFPLPIGYGQSTVRPYTAAFMLEHLCLTKGQTVLEVGAGSCWMAALMGYIVGNTGHVYAVERIPELTAFGKENLAKYNLPHVEVLPTGNTLGLPEHSPYDRVVVSASTDVLPQELVEQLTVGGIMIIPIGPYICRITRTSAQNHTTERFKGFAFVPLVGS